MKGGIQVAVGWPNIDQEAELAFGCCNEQRLVQVRSYEDDECVLVTGEHACDAASEQNPHLLAWLSQNSYFTRNVTVETIDESSLRAHEAGECKRYERRAFVRLDATFPVTVIADGVEVATITAADVSESGIRGVMSPDKPAALPHLFTLQLHLNDKTITTDAGVAWTAIDNSSNEERALTGFSFVNPSEPATDAIRSYIFAVQMMRRREENEKSARV